VSFPWGNHKKAVMCYTSGLFFLQKKVYTKITYINHMTTISLSNQQKKTLKKLGVHTVYVFGSQVEGVAHKSSDIDIGVVFNDPEQYRDNTMEAYTALYDLFTDLFPRKKVDIVFLQFAPIRLQHSAVFDGKVLYEADQDKRYDYQEYVLRKQCDLKHFQTMHEQAVLASI
jgi:uncharacterized protein